MRIISKINDFYDYLSDPTDTLVFDRRESFVLDKHNILRDFNWDSDRSKYRFVILQCGVTYWLFLVNSEDNYMKSFNVELLSTWKNYNKTRKLIALNDIDIYGIYNYKDYTIKDYSYDKLKNNINTLVEKINRNEYKSLHNYSYTQKYTNDKKAKMGYTTKTIEIPILKASGFASVIDPTEIFCAIEEYFSLEKTAAEKITAEGTTNNDKIHMHGFDIKTSFRGKITK